LPEIGGSPAYREESSGSTAVRLGFDDRSAIVGASAVAGRQQLTVHSADPLEVAIECEQRAAAVDGGGRDPDVSFTGIGVPSRFRVEKTRP